MTGYIFIHPVILLLIILSLGFILRTVQSLLFRLHIMDKSNHQEYLQMLFLFNSTFRISLFGVVNIFTDRANVLFHNVRIFNWFSK